MLRKLKEKVHRNKEHLTSFDQKPYNSIDASDGRLRRKIRRSLNPLSTMTVSTVEANSSNLIRSLEPQKRGS